MIPQVFNVILRLSSTTSAAPISDSDSSGSELLNPKGFGKTGKLPNLHSARARVLRAAKR
jgi:hypothetical protein